MKLGASLESPSAWRSRVIAQFTGLAIDLEAAKANSSADVTAVVHWPPLIDIGRLYAAAIAADRNQRRQYRTGSSTGRGNEPLPATRRRAPTKNQRIGVPSRRSVTGTSEGPSDWKSAACSIGSGQLKTGNGAGPMHSSFAIFTCPSSVLASLNRRSIETRNHARTSPVLLSASRNSVTAWGKYMLLFSRTSHLHQYVK